MIFDNNNDLHVIVRTAEGVLLDTVACEVEVEDHLGRFVVHAGGAALAALVPSEIVIRRGDGSEARIEIPLGSLTAAGSQLRIIVREGVVREVPAPLPIAV